MISYSREDRPCVLKLAAALREMKREVWFDEGLAPGDEISQLIDSKITDASAVLVVWSKNASNSKWVRAEALRAFYLDKKLIVAVTDQCPVPVPFNSLHYVNLSDWRFDPRDPKIGQIIAALPIDERSPHSDREPRTSLEEIAGFLDAKARIKVIERIAVGELSDVYRAEHGARRLAIKALPDALLPSTFKKSILEEVALASNVNHPSFLRISDVLYDKHVYFIVSDHVEGEETIAQRIKAEGADAFSIEEVVDVLNQLCEAVVEAEVAGLGYVSITPSQIFVKDDRTQLLAQDGAIDITSDLNRRKFTRKVVRLSPINFTHHVKNRLGWNNNTGPFIPPEYWQPTSWFKDHMEKAFGRGLPDDELRRARLQRSHQFALGMLAWTMLEGRVPFTSDLKDVELEDVDRLEDIKHQFLEESERFSQRIAAARWRTDGRALARIIQRMVEHDPAKRWSSMNQVRLLVQALAASYAANNLDNLVKEAYQIVARGKYEFYRNFYEKLFRDAEHLGDKFKGIDMERQHRMLDYAIGQLLNFNQQQSEPSTLTQFVERHQQLGLSKDDFEKFGNALIESFDIGLARERKRQRMMAALEIVIWPGIYYMIQHCTSERGASSS
jgi:serine/threonine protein kinase